MSCIIMQHPCLPYAPFARQIPHYFRQTRIGLREVFLKEREAVVAVNERIGYKSLRMCRMVSFSEAESPACFSQTRAPKSEHLALHRRSGSLDRRPHVRPAAAPTRSCKRKQSVSNGLERTRSYRLHVNGYLRVPHEPSTATEVIE